MRVYPNRNDEDSDPNAVDQMMNFTQSSYRSFTDYVAFRDDDPGWMILYKVVLRFFGILFMILLSPFLVIGLMIAFAAVF